STIDKRIRVVAKPLRIEVAIRQRGCGDELRAASSRITRRVWMDGRSDGVAIHKIGPICRRAAEARAGQVCEPSAVRGTSPAPAQRVRTRRNRHRPATKPADLLFGSEV